MSTKLTATINSTGQPIDLERSAPGQPWRVADESAAADLVRTGPAVYSVVHNGRSHRALVLKRDAANGTVRLRIGARCYTVRLEDERAQLMKLLGIDRGAKAMASELKAPMPGLVLDILVQEGAEVKKNDPLLVLEAMKMENVIKSGGDGVVRKIHAQAGTAVEKGQLLISFE
jgi:biotin carboxyl carrier protein